ncbi:MAG: glycosyltransferase family 4 protein [Anaerolineae bacterium]|nr:glycosyltransferase family 4 protein [Anaerolineae bacterium]
MAPVRERQGRDAVANEAGSPGGSARRKLTVERGQVVVMRVALDVQSTLGQPTGIGQYAGQLLAALRRVAPEHEFMGLSWGREVVMRTDRRLRWQQWELPRRAKAAGTDVLHVTGFDAPCFRPCPVVLTVHDLVGMLFPQSLPPIARLYWARWLPHSVRWATRIIADSYHTRADLIRLLGVRPERIEVVYLGVDETFRPVTDPVALAAVRERYGLPERVILYLGTLEPRKGLDTLIAAFARLAGDLPHHLVIAGKRGWYTEPLFRQVRALGLERRVHFPGYVAAGDQAALYSLADLFASPSRYEGFGLPVLEAMACGTPVVCSQAASLPEVAGDAAVLVPPGDVEALAAGLRGVLQDSALRQGLRERGLERAHRFTWEETARRTLAVYEQVR